MGVGRRVDVGFRRLFKGKPPVFESPNDGRFCASRDKDVIGLSRKSVVSRSSKNLIFAFRGKNSQKQVRS